MARHGTARKKMMKRQKPVARKLFQGATTRANASSGHGFAERAGTPDHSDTTSSLPSETSVSPTPRAERKKIDRPREKAEVKASMKTTSGKKKKAVAGANEKDVHREDTNPSSPSSISYENAGPVVASDGESDDGQEWCICRGPDDGRKMINCDGCHDWFHLVCLKIPDHMGDLIRDFYCPKCTDYSHRTMYHPHCTLKNCMKPARPALYPVGNWKFCSDAHGHKYAERTIELARKDDAPTRGGVITQGELLAMLEQTDSLEEFRRLGRKPKFSNKSNATTTATIKPDVQIKEEPVATPTVISSSNVVESIENLLFPNGADTDAMDVDNPTDDNPVDLTPLHIRGGDYSEHAQNGHDPDNDNYSDPGQWDAQLLNDDEALRMEEIAHNKIALKNTVKLYKMKARLLDTMREKNVVLLAKIKTFDSSYRAICAFNSALAMNEDQFAAFNAKYDGAGFESPDVTATTLSSGDSKIHTIYARDDGLEEFHSICLRKKCVKHGDWHRMFKDDAKYQTFLANRTIIKLEKEESDIREVAQVRALRAT